MTTICIQTADYCDDLGYKTEVKYIYERKNDDEFFVPEIDIEIGKNELIHSVKIDLHYNYGKEATLYLVKKILNDYDISIDKILDIELKDINGLGFSQKYSNNNIIIGFYYYPNKDFRFATISKCEMDFY